MHTDTAPLGSFSNSNLNHGGHAHDQPSPWSTVSNGESDIDACALLLARVDFKWLMAGQGWWIDPHRLQHEASYADAVLRFALESQSLALRKCAVLIRTQLGYPPSHWFKSIGLILCLQMTFAVHAGWIYPANSRILHIARFQTNSSWMLTWHPKVWSDS